MATNRYYFSDNIEDDVLRDLAVKTKQTMHYNEHLVEIFRINNEPLYGHSPGKVLFLIQQNNQSIFSPSSIKENNPSDTKPDEEVGNIDASSQESPRPSGIIQTSPSFAKAEKVFGSKAKDVGSIDASSQESPRPSGIMQTSPSFTKAEKVFGIKAKEVGNIVASSQESPRRSSIIQSSPSFTKAEKVFGNKAKEVGSIKLGNQESPRSAEIIKLTSRLKVGDKGCRNVNRDVWRNEIQIDSNSAKNKDASPYPEENADKSENSKDRKRKSLSPRRRSTEPFESGTQESHLATEKTSGLIGDDKVCRNLVQDDLQAGISAISKDSPNPEEYVGESKNHDLTDKYFISQAAGMNNSEPAQIAREIPSPGKRSRRYTIPTFSTHDFASNSKEYMKENSPEGSKVNVNRILCDEMNESPKEAIKDIVGDGRKRKSLSPRKNTTFKSMPRVTKSAGQEEIDIEVVDLDYEANPRVPRSNSADSRRDSTKDSNMKSPVHGGESKTDTSPKTPERYLSPSERAIASETNSSVSGDNVFAGENPSCSPPIAATATRNLPSECAHYSADIKDGPTFHKSAVVNFNSLLFLRDKAVKKFFDSFRKFQISVNFMLSYIDNIIHIINRLDDYGKYSTKQLREIYSYSNALYVKLLIQLKLWKKDVDFDIDTWQKCFLRIEQLKAQYEPLFTNEDEPAVTFEAVQQYECEIKAIWKKMDYMVLQLDLRRASFSNIAQDVVRLIKMLVKSLILVRILQSR